MQKLLLPALLLSVFLPFTCQANQEVVATVVALRNSATATSLEGAVRNLSSKAPIHEGDTIQTGKRGRIQIIFTDNTIISLGRNANLSIHEYLWQPDLDKGTLRTEVKEGIFRIMGGAITKTNPENFTTKTPAATIGIRGSMYAGKVSGNTLSVVFQGGRGIYVENQHGRVEIPTVGHGTNVLSTQPPPAPIRFTPQEIDALAPSEASAINEEIEETGEELAEAGVATVEEGEEIVTLIEEEGDLLPLLTTSSTTDILVTLPPVNEYPNWVPFDPPPWTPPTTGITHFLGSINGLSTDINNGTTEAITEPMEVFANWHNHTVIGVSHDQNFPGLPVIFFGKISGTSVTGIKFFGGSGGESEISSIEGTGSGVFGGTLYGNFSLAASGADYAIEPFSQPPLATWSVGGFAQEDITKASLSGTQTWKGYVVGLGENMADINTNRHLMRNGNQGDFTMTINKDTGTIAGSLTASDGSFVTSLTVGGDTSNSAYVHDHLMGAFLSGTVTDGGTESIKDHGNYLISGPMDQQNIAYATWGYWEVAYQNPGTSEQYHNHVPGALWIAGAPTSSTDLAALAAGNVTGQYAGEVRGSKIQTGGMVSEVLGSFQMNVDFANLGAASGFNGTMQLDGHNFNTHSISGPGDGSFTNGNIDGDGFSGDISGTLYGPAATSIGGNFKTSNGSETYQGIYGGNR